MARIHYRFGHAALLRRSCPLDRVGRRGTGTSGKRWTPQRQSMRNGGCDPGRHAPDPSAPAPATAHDEPGSYRLHYGRRMARPPSAFGANPLIHAMLPAKVMSAIQTRRNECCRVAAMHRHFHYISGRKAVSGVRPHRSGSPVRAATAGPQAACGRIEKTQRGWVRFLPVATWATGGARSQKSPRWMALRPRQ